MRVSWREAEKVDASGASATVHCRESTQTYGRHDNQVISLRYGIGERRVRQVRCPDISAAIHCLFGHVRLQLSLRMC